MSTFFFCAFLSTTRIQFVSPAKRRWRNGFASRLSQRLFGFFGRKPRRHNDTKVHREHCLCVSLCRRVVVIQGMLLKPLSKRILMSVRLLLKNVVGACLISLSSAVPGSPGLLFLCSPPLSHAFNDSIQLNFLTCVSYSNTEKRLLYY